MAIAVKVMILVAVVAGGQCAKLIIKNNEIGPVWIGIIGKVGQSSPSKGGVIVESFANETVIVPDDWSGTIWPRTWCYPDTKICDTGDCGKGLECNGTRGTAPTTLVHITLNGDGGRDDYEISLVEGFNIKASIQPVDGRGKRGKNTCQKAECNYYINDECPEELKLIGPHASFPIACKSSCVAFNTDDYCCRNKYDAAGKCKSTDFPINYPAFFKKRCPHARTYKYDNKNNTHTCTANTYLIIFG